MDMSELVFFYFNFFNLVKSLLAWPLNSIEVGHSVQGVSKLLPKGAIILHREGGRLFVGGGGPEFFTRGPRGGTKFFCAYQGGTRKNWRPVIRNRRPPLLVKIQQN